MQIDKITYDDLSLYSGEEEFSIFHKINFTTTRGGRDWLLEYFNSPFSQLKPIEETQQILQLIIRHRNQWPSTISNGTIMVMEKFFETSVDDIPAGGNLVNAGLYKILHGPDYSIVRYSLSHFADFVRGMHAIIDLFSQEDCPKLLGSLLERAGYLLSNDTIESLAKTRPGSKFTVSSVIHYGSFIRYKFKNAAQELINIFGRIDAWYSMAMATQQLGFAFPEFLEQDQPVVDAVDLYHILLPVPVSYNVQLNQKSNFFFLTGANMAGKSTFIKSVGIAVFLAHLGMGVPSKQMKLTIFDGILSNINVVDNISKGESYFFNEVQRIKNTIIKINDNRKWLVLIDELFKGTNVQDAMKCSSTVIKGLIKINNSLFILSTHLYEIGEELKSYPNISFKYFETSVKDDQLEFSYQLKDGISNDRLGYLILKREKVVEMLEKL